MNDAAKTANALARAESFGLVLPLTYKGARAGERYQACPGVPTQPAESCDACGQSIMEVHVFTDATGRTFKVGCDCVYRYLPAANHAAVKREHAKIEKAKRDARNAKRREKAAARAAELRAELAALIEAKADDLAALPHPQPWAAERGETMLDQAKWMLANGGANAWAKMIAAIG